MPMLYYIALMTGETLRGMVTSQLHANNSMMHHAGCYILYHLDDNENDDDDNDNEISSHVLSTCTGLPHL